jgi:hypothetical protein
MRSALVLSVQLLRHWPGENDIEVEKQSNGGGAGRVQISSS